MGGATSGKFTVKSCGRAHAWCAECRPAQAAAQRKPSKAEEGARQTMQELRTLRCVPRQGGSRRHEGLPLVRRDQGRSTAFARRNDTGGYRNQCMACRNSGQVSARCEGCGSSSLAGDDGAPVVRRCRPPVTKPCARCGTEFVGSMEQRRYCSPECRDATLGRAAAGGPPEGTSGKRCRRTAARSRSCVCCGEEMFQFLALDHINGGGHAHRKETGGGGFYSWLAATTTRPGSGCCATTATSADRSTAAPVRTRRDEHGIQGQPAHGQHPVRPRPRTPRRRSTRPRHDLRRVGRRVHPDEDADDEEGRRPARPRTSSPGTSKTTEARPIPATREGIRAIDTSLLTALTTAWVKAMTGVHDADPLPQSSPSGGPSLVESVPMEALSPSLAS
jgi:hypothetical protein